MHPVAEGVPQKPSLGQRGLWFVAGHRLHRPLNRGPDLTVGSTIIEMWMAMGVSCPSCGRRRFDGRGSMPSERANKGRTWWWGNERVSL